MAQLPHDLSELIGHSESTELSSQRTAMAFDRTAMSSDRTLMAAVRTALSLIGFGFTIFTFFHKLSERFIPSEFATDAPRRFGGALIILGIILLALGIYNHRKETSERRRRRQLLYDAKLVHAIEEKRPNSSMIMAILLLMIGVLAILRVGLAAGPF